MVPFKGFADLAAEEISVPEPFLTDVLAQIDSLDELKICLQFFRWLKSQPGPDRYVTLEVVLEHAVQENAAFTNERILNAINLACEHGILLQAKFGEGVLIFLNTPRARAIQKAIARGVWRPDLMQASVVQPQRPNLYQLYEQNIGPLTPILSQVLADAENTYPAEWLEEAISLAVKKNVRNWNYVEAILRSWKERGRNETDRRNSKENPRDYIEGDLADYIKH